MESGLLATLIIGSLIGTGAVAGTVAMNGNMMQGDMTSGGMMDGGMMGGMMNGMGDGGYTSEGMQHRHEEMHCHGDNEGFEHDEDCQEHRYEEFEEHQWMHEHCEGEDEHEEDLPDEIDENLTAG